MKQGFVFRSIITTVLAVFAFSVSARLQLFAQTELFSTSEYQSWSVPGDRPVTMAFSSDGKELAIGTQSGKVGIFDVGPNSSPKWLTQHSGRVTSLAFSRTGSQLASAGQDGIVKVINMASGAVTDLRGHHGKVWTVAFSPKGEFLASAGDDKTVIVWDPVGRKELYRLANGGSKAIKLVSFREKGNTVTSIVAVGEGGVISEWDVKNRSLLRQIQESDKNVLSAATNFSGTHLSIGTEFSDLQKGTFTLSRGPIRPTDLYREDRIKLYDLETGKVAKTLDGINGEVRSLSVSADSRYIAAARVRATESFLDVFDLQRGVEIFSRPTPGGTEVVAFSPDGQWLSAGSGNGEIAVLKVQGVRPYGDVPVLDVKFQPLGNQQTPLIAANANPILAIMDLDPQEIEVGTARAVSDMLRTEIAGSGNVRLVDRTRIEQILKEQDFQHSGRTDQAMAVQVGKILNARKMIFGSVSKLGTSITISTQLLDVETAGVDGIRGILCQQCALEDLPKAVAELRLWIVADSSQGSVRAPVAPSRPRISIVLPSQNMIVQNNQVLFKADIEDDAGIKSAELLVNGGFEKSQRTLLTTDVAGQHSLKVERTLALEPGANIVAIRVENTPGLIEEESRIVRVQAAGLSPRIPSSSGKRWALIVGVSKYQDPKIPQLEFADHDAQALSDVLSTGALGGFSPARKLVLLNEQATTAGVTKALRSFLQKPDADDTVVIYLAGHGSPDPRRPDNVYFITYDTQADDIAGTALPMREIETALKENLLARRVIVLSDACHSGVIGTAGRRDLVYSPSEAMNRTLDELAKQAKPGTAIFTSARSGETSLEGGKWGGGHGVFTWFLLRGLQGSADLNGDGIISLDELFTYVKEHVKQETDDQQHPVVVSDSYDPQLPLAVLSRP